jgi:predicted Rossmann fold flavoprotein
MKPRTVLVAGGGASGLMAAIMAAREGARVTILEHNDRNGRKLNATGNGRCNFTNEVWPEDALRGTHPAFANSALRQFGVKDTLAFFTRLGAAPVSRNGYYYPRCGQAQAVTDLLSMEAQSLGVKGKTREHITAIQKDNATGQWQVLTEGWHYEADAVILACGSGASSVAGADGSGYHLAASLGHTIIPPLPALTGLRLSDEKKSLSKWAGVRTDGSISIYVDDVLTATARGELQLTDYGVSGIPTFQVSRYAIRAQKGGHKVTAVLDFMPDLTAGELSRLLEERRQACPYKKESQLLTGLFPEKLITVLAASPSIEKAIKETTRNVRECLSLAQAQVASGGISTDEIHPDTMESRLHPGIYFAGELIDIDGTCGGYNLQWAWSSGAVAGRHAARKEQK